MTLSELFQILVASVGSIGFTPPQPDSIKTESASRAARKNSFFMCHPPVGDRRIRICGNEKYNYSQYTAKI